MTASVRSRPIYGGVFGHGRYALATVPCTSRGLHSVRYMVIEPRGGAVLSVDEDKLRALAAARRVIKAGQAVAQQVEHAAALAAGQAKFWPDSEMPIDSHRRRPVSKRRREIFAKCEGRCHYCTTPLTLDGKWHIEHMLPKALGGGDDLINLVAACVPCNLAKSDSTAIEFVTRQER